jgi:type II secretory pathway component PulF
MMQMECANGSAFADTLEKLQFDSHIVYIVRASENHQALLRGLQSALRFSQNYLNNRKEFTKKLRYPLFLFAIIILVIFVIFLFFIPKLGEFYATFGVEGNHLAITVIITTLGMVLAGFSSVFVSILLFLKYDNEKFQKWCRKWIFQVPGLRKLSTRLFSYYFATQIELFITCGLSLKESIVTIREFETTPLAKIIINEMEQRIEGGESVEEIIKEHNCFTPYFRLIVSHAAQIGKLDDHLASFIKAELTILNNGVSYFIKIFQGTFLALVGGLIVLLYISILQPVFELIEII